MPYRNNVVKVLTWGGLRGGIAVVLALSFPAGPYRAVILVGTYTVVVFSIAVQELPTKWFFKRWCRDAG